MIYSSSQRLLSSHKSGFNRLAREICHAPHVMPIHPPYLPDLIPCGFYLFPTVKEKLERIQVVDEDQFSEFLQNILRNIDQEELKVVFQA
jgi:hypothetical protein